MKAIFTVCLLLIATVTVVSGQKRERALGRSQIREAETRLKELGYWGGPVDGVFDSATQSALIAFQK